jgi:hypothetical protein
MAAAIRLNEQHSCSLLPAKCPLRGHHTARVISGKPRSKYIRSGLPPGADISRYPSAIPSRAEATTGRCSNKSSSAVPRLDWDTLSRESCLEVLAMPRSDRTARSKLLNALEKLHRDLARAFDQEPDYPSDPMNERERYAAALIVVAQYFSSLSEKPIAARFFELASAIADLNHGTVHPLLQQVRPDNRPADPSQLWRARARVALGLEALLRSGLNRSDAAAKITSGYSSIANLAGVKAKDSKLQTIVFGWRRELKAGRVKNFEASELFAEGIKRIDRLASPQEHRKFAIRQFAEAANSSCVFSPSA